MQPVINMFHEHHGSFGRRTLKVLLERKGISFSEWKISRIMKINGLWSKYKIKKLKNVYTSVNTKKYIKDNIYVTLTDEEKKKEIWSTDFTEEKVEGKTIYTCGIKSINSRVIVGFRISTKISSKLAIETLLDAIENFGIPDMMLTDRGPQFISKAYQDILKEYGIMHSMSRPHYAVDNCFIETFWKTIKTEIGPVKNYTVNQYIMIMNYFWDYYNYRRPHSSLNYKSPITINLKRCN
jgi:putative transposase